MPKKNALGVARTMDGDAEWLTPKAAAALLGISVDTIYDACAAGELRHARLGHSTIRIRRPWLDTWMDAHVRG